VRIASSPIQRRNQVLAPAYLIIQDQALLNTPGVLDGLLPDGGILINSPLSSAELSQQAGREMISIPASSLAKQILGRPVPNTALLAAFLSLTGILPVEALGKALSGRFKGPVLDKNLQLIHQAAELVPTGQWKR